VKLLFVTRRAKLRGDVRLDHNQLGIVRRATRRWHWLWRAGASLQRGNLNLKKRVIWEMPV
jgi:hypothetical protein